MAPRKGAKSAAKSAKAPKAAKPSGAKGTTKRPEAGADEVPTYRVDMGEGLPPQAPFPTGTDRKK